MRRRAAGSIGDSSPGGTPCPSRGQTTRDLHATPADPDSAVWLYHAHDHENLDIQAGLIGLIIDENKSPYLERNVEEFAPDGPVKNDDEFKESNRKHAINGLLYANLDGLTLRKKERVRWYLMALGNENDIHGRRNDDPLRCSRHRGGTRSVEVGSLPQALVRARRASPGKRFSLLSLCSRCRRRPTGLLRPRPRDCA